MVVVVKKVGEAPKVKEIENNLAEMQDIVGGYIELVDLPNGLHLICNEEGRLYGLPYNFTLDKTNIVGDVLFARSNGRDFIDLTDNDVETILQMFSIAE